jgi:hypothetical protein
MCRISSEWADLMHWCSGCAHWYTMAAWRYRTKHARLLACSSRDCSKRGSCCVLTQTRALVCMCLIAARLIGASGAMRSAPPSTRPSRVRLLTWPPRPWWLLTPARSSRRWATSCSCRCGVLCVWGGAACSGCVVAAGVLQMRFIWEVGNFVSKWVNQAFEHVDTLNNSQYIES